jgi:hypothetical protein
VQGLHNSPRHGTNVGAAVSPKFCFISQSAEADALEGTTQGAGNGATQAGFTDSCWSSKANHCPDAVAGRRFLLCLLLCRLLRLTCLSHSFELEGCQVFNDPVFNFGQTIVIGIQDFPGLLEIEIVAWFKNRLFWVTKQQKSSHPQDGYKRNTKGEVEASLSYNG